MSKGLIRSVIIIFFCLLSVSLFSEKKTDNKLPDNYTLTILHTNDFHGADYMRLAKIATIVKKIRAEEKNVLYLDAGDTFARGDYHYEFYGELEFAILNALQCDALTLGNNEFKATEDATTSRNYLYARIAEAKFPVLCANIRTLSDYSLLPNVKAYTIVNRGGVRIGILGVSTSRISSYPQSKGFVVEDPVRVARKIYPNIKAESDFVISLTHTGFDTDKLIAKAIPGLAAIVGGDSHTILYEPFDKNKVPVVQAGSNGLYLGRLDLFFERVNDSLVLKKYTGTLIEVDDTISEDREIIELIGTFMKRLAKKAA